MVVNAIGAHITQTLGILLFCIAGVFGVESVAVMPDGIAADTNGAFGFAVGSFVVAPRSEWAHEFGHVQQFDILGGLYLPLVGLTSIYGALTASNQEEYLSLWSERWADRLGGVVR